MAYETLIIEADGRVRVIRLNRPQALNALNARLLSELAAALGEAGSDPGVGCVVLTGSERAFAAGADVKEMAGKSYAEAFTADLFTSAAKAIEGFRKPIVAGVRGYALGGGCELAMMCDIIIAGEDAKFGQPEITLGVTPGLGGTQRLTRLVGKAKAMDLVLTGRMMDAAEAERCGLVSRVVASERVEAEAKEAAAKIASYSPLAVMMNKELVGAAMETTLATGLALERRLFHSLFAFADQKEGMAAFVEKRPPQWRGE